MDKKTYDFSGYATRFDVKCSDGRTIKKSAFKNDNGITVPMVWNHNHSSADNVLGHALLEYREDGMYSYCSFNDTEQGRTAKELVKHGDICSLSIYANQLKQNGGDVIHGSIREVSLVLAGANPGAKIENVISHGAVDSEQAILFNASETFEFDVEKKEAKNSDEAKHSDESTTIAEEQGDSEVKPENQTEIQHADAEAEKKDKTVKEIYDTLNEDQKLLMDYLVGAALAEAQKENAKEENNQEDNKDMKQNAFESTNNENQNVLAHSDIVAAIETAKKTGSLKDAINDMCLKHGIDNIDVLFPEVKAISTTPATINDDTTWVGKVMGKVHHTPFSRVKMLAFDITGDEARARGYIKGNQKEEEVIAALRRETSPQTVYKLQKLDRDDIIDVTDLDVVAYIKQEMRGKLDEEIARAILTGDGRSAASKDKINPLNIRPILGDDATYVVSKHLEKGAMDEYAFAKFFIKQCIKARKEYKGSGNPTLFCTEDLLTDMLLIEDKNERVIYDTIEKLKTALRVSDIVTPPYFASQSRSQDGYTYNLMGILVNLNDYNVGADKGGAVSMFDDFDLDFNKYEYLIETRISGAMVKPFGAITFEQKIAETNNQGE